MSTANYVFAGSLLSVDIVKFGHETKHAGMFLSAKGAMEGLRASFEVPLLC